MGCCLESVWTNICKNWFHQIKDEVSLSSKTKSWRVKKKKSAHRYKTFRPIDTIVIGKVIHVKVARYSFLEWIPPTFERKLRRHKQRFGQINTTVVLDKDETLLWSGLQWHRSCHGNEMTPFPILLAAVFLGTGNCSSKIVYWSFFLQ